MAQDFERSIWNQTILLHAIAFLVILSLTEFSMRDYLAGNSFFVYRDVGVTQPEDTLEKGLSAFDLDSTRRMLHLGPFYTMTSFLGFSPLDVQKATFLLTNIMVGYFAYYASFKFLLSHTTKSYRRLHYVFASAMIFSFFYMFNPRAAAGSLGETGWGLTFSYALIPIIFYFFDRSLNKKGFQNIFITSMLIALAVAGTQQYLVLLPTFVLIPWLTITLIKRRMLHRPLTIAIKNSIIIFALWLCISSYWIVVTAITISEGSTPKPGYVLTYQMLENFSSTNEFVNVIRLMGVWWPYVELAPIIDPSLWTFMTFAIPITFVFTLIFVKDRSFRFLSISMALIAVIIMFFNKGTQEPFSNLYPGLYGIPIVGWMFRVPSHSGVFLPFFMGMVITIGIYVLLSSFRKTIFIQAAKFIIPALFIFSISLVGWQSFTGDFAGTFKENESYSMLKAKPDQEPNFHSYSQYLALGNESKAQILKALQSFGSNAPPMIMKDHDLNIIKSLPPDPSNTIILDDYSDLQFYFLDSDSIVVRPFEATRNHLPEKLWSVGGTDDPLHGEFHPYLKRFDLKNDDSDYGQGLVFTWALDELHLPVTVEKGGKYYAYARYLENEKGGNVEISSDSDEIHAILSTKGVRNEFVWSNIGIFDLTKGSQDVILKNDGTFNAINILVLIPVDSLPKIQKEVDFYSKNTQILYMLHPSDFRREAVGDAILFEENSVSYVGTTNVEFSKSLGATHMSLQFGTKVHDQNIPSSYKIDAIHLNPLYNKVLLTSNFEDAKEFEGWSSQSKSATLSPETIHPMSGAKSLHVVVENGTSNLWHAVSSERYPVKGNVRVTSNITVLELHTMGLHGKLIFYDKDNNELDKWDLAFTLKDSISAQTFSKTFTSPANAEFFSFQLWSRQNPERPSEYWIDNVSITQEYPDLLSNTNWTLENLNNTSQILVDNNPLVVKTTEYSRDGFILIQTEPVSIVDDSTFTLSLSAEIENTDTFFVKAIYYKYPEKLEKPADMQEILLEPQTQINSDFMLPISNYTVAIEVDSCQDCQWLRVSSSNAFEVIPISESNDSTPRWIYSTIETSSVENNLKIESGGSVVLGNIMIYPEKDKDNLLDLLSQRSSQPSVLDYRKLSATKYEVIVNAPQPFLLTMDAPYDRSWSALANGKSYDSTIVYPGKSAFYIEEIGNVKVTLEYGLQKWFLAGSIITIVTIIASTGLLLYLKYRLTMQILLARILKDSSNIIYLGRKT